MSNSSATSSINLPTVVFIVFLILKLTHVIDWSWWWVTSPLWIGFGISIISLVFFIWIYKKIF